MYNFSLRENNNVKKLRKSKPIYPFSHCNEPSKAPSEESEAEKGAWLNCAWWQNHSSERRDACLRAPVVFCLLHTRARFSLSVSVNWHRQIEWQAVFTRCFVEKKGSILCFYSKKTHFVCHFLWGIKYVVLIVTENVSLPSNDNTCLCVVA